MNLPLTGWEPSPQDPNDIVHRNDGTNAALPIVSVDCRSIHLQRAQWTPSCVGYGLGQALQDWDLQLFALDAPIHVERPDGSTFATTRKAFTASVLEPLSCNWNWTLGRIYALNDLGTPPPADVGLPPDIGTNARFAIAGMRDQMCRAEADWPDDPARAKMMPDAAVATAEPLLRVPHNGWVRIDTTDADDFLQSLSVILQGAKAGKNSKPTVAMPIGAAYCATPDNGVYNLAAETGPTTGHQQTIGAVDVPNRLFYAHWTWYGMAAGCWIRADDFVKITVEHGWYFTSIVYMEKVA